MKKFLIASTALLALVACGEKKAADTTSGTASAVSAPAGTTWTETTSTSTYGGMVMGNPAAAVKLVEYGALTCSHCATFSEESGAELKAMVAKGTVSYEFRNFLLSPIDIPAALLARCAGPGPFFPISEQLFAAQSDWLGKTKEITEAEQTAWANYTPVQLTGILATKLGLDTFVQQRGISADKAKACLADAKAIDALTKMSQVGQSEFKVQGTPTFVINGLTAEATGDWATLKPKLIAAGA